MRRVLLLPILLLLLWGCTKSDLTENIEIADIDQSTSITISIDSESLTRGSVVDSEEAMGTVGMYCAHTGTENWDTSTTFGKMENEQFTYDAATGWSGASGITWGHDSATDKYTFYAYSPYVANKTNYTIENGGLVINYTVPTTCANQKDLLVAEPRKNIYPQMGGKVRLDFDHVLAKVSFSVKGNDSDRTIKGIELEKIISNGKYIADIKQWDKTSFNTPTTFTVTVDDGDLDEIEEKDTENDTQMTTGTGYLFLIPQTASEKTVNIMLSDGSTHELEIPEGTVWEAGKSYNYCVTLDEEIIPSFSETYSKVANCYMIKTSTTNDIIIPINEYISYFWKEYGNDDEEIANGDVTIDDIEAKVIWYDSQTSPINGSVSIMSIDKSSEVADANISTIEDFILRNYPDFTVSTTTMAMSFKINTGIPSNCLIGVRKKNSSEYLWSWHIWITDYDPYTTGGVSADGNTWMDRNLGARDATFNKEGVLHYQWGRKDPIPTHNGNNLNTETAQGNTIANAVKKPDTFYCTPTDNGDENRLISFFDWCGSGTITWDQYRAHHWRDKTLKICRKGVTETYDNRKSIFDPSPLGWMIPCTKDLSANSWINPFQFLSSASNDKTLGGLNYNNNSLFFPGLDFRQGVDGALTKGDDLKENVYSGGYWTTTATGTTNGYLLVATFGSTKVSASTKRAFGYQIRAIKEYE